MLHTRISEQLSDDIRRLADDLRVPVSNLVRNVLEEVFTTVENVSGDVGDFFEEVIDEAEAVRERINSRRSRSGTKSDGGSDESVEDELRQDEATESGSAPPELHSDVVGWQPIIVHRNTPCGDCGVQLSPGDQALLGIRESGRPGRPICNDCSPMHD